LERKIVDLKGKIRAEEERLKARNGGSSTRLVDSIKVLQAERDELASQKSQIEGEREEKARVHQAAVQAKKEADARVTSKQKEMSDKRQLFERLNRAGTDPLAGFHPRMGQFLDAISNEGGFRRKPIGPLGTYMSLKKPEWSTIVEKFFGSKLNGFVVTCHEDGRLMDSILKRNMISGIPYSVLPPKNLTLDEPAAIYDTLLRVLDIKDEAVRAQLIVFSGVEQVILIKDLEEANRVMGNRRPNDNISSCYALHRSRPGYGYKVGGSYGVMGVVPITTWSGMARIRSQGMNQRDIVQADIDRLEGELRGLRSTAHSAAAIEAERRKTIKSAENRRQGLVIDIQRKEDNIERLQNEIDEIAADGELNVVQKKLQVSLRVTTSRTYMYADRCI